MFVVLDADAVNFQWYMLADVLGNFRISSKIQLSDNQLEFLLSKAQGWGYPIDTSGLNVQYYNCSSYMS